MSKSHSGKNHYGYGKHLSENHKHKLRDKKIGKKLTKGHINNIVKSLIGRKHSEETKLKMNRLKEIPIIATNIITGEKIRFKSISYAAKSIGDKDEGNISTGIKNNKIRYGYTWKKDEVK